MKPNRYALIPTPLALVEDAIRLLRAHPEALLTYLSGSLPFAVALLYFWADMSRGAFAEERCAVAAVGLGGLFLWMKTAHAIFCAQLLSRVGNSPPRPWTVGRCFRAMAVQAALQPAGLVLLPAPFLGILAPALAKEEQMLAALLMLIGGVLGLTFAWMYAFFQGATVAADRAEGIARVAWRDAWRQAVLWPAQNHSALALLGVFGLFVFLNTVVGLISLPALLKLLLGVESDFTLSQWSMFNTTFLFTAATLTWLVLDPVAKAFYVLRSFRGEAIRSGADLRAQLRALQPGGLLLVLLLWFAMSPASGHAAETSDPPAGTPAATAEVGGAKAVDPLGHAMDEVLARRVYTWREPRERRIDKEEEGDWLARALKSLEQSLEGALRSLGRAAYKFIDWLLLRRLRLGGGGGNTSLFDWTSGLDLVLYGLLAVGLAFLLFQAYRVLRRRAVVPTLETLPARVHPDLRDENVAADQLPEDGWLGMARDLAGRGELRLALRALYLASLAGLARREWVTLARHKSNRDYAGEMERRARALPQAQATFTGLVAAFDRVWYGTHDVNTETLARFEGEVRALLVETRSE